MYRLALLALFVPAVALAAEESAAAPDTQKETQKDPMAGWVPRKVTKADQDKKEITAVFKAMENAAKAGNLEAAAALVDFPVLMITDDSKGEATGEAWDREKWTQVMAPFYKNPMDMKVTHKPTIFLVTDSIASVGDECTMTMGKKTVTSRNNTLLVRKDGKWLVKSMAEGGWGDVMAESASAATTTK